MKKFNKKGFTLIELLAVIVILALLVAVAIPAVTKYLNTSRKGVFADNAAAAISAVRNDVIINGITEKATYYIGTANKGEIKAYPDDEYVNDLLEKKLNKSPYGEPYSGIIEVEHTDSTNTTTYSIYLTDGTNCIGTKAEPAPENDVDAENVKVNDECKTLVEAFKSAS